MALCFQINDSSLEYSYRTLSIIILNCFHHIKERNGYVEVQKLPSVNLFFV